MRPRLPTLAAAILAVALAAAPSVAQVAPEARIHPRIPLLDVGGRNVLDTGAPVSLRATCGQCHDVDYIITHTIHAGPGLESAGSLAEAVSSRPRDPSGMDAGEMNCFLCHMRNPANQARTAALREGRAEWAPTATLANAGIAVQADGQWRWNRAAFDAAGNVRDTVLALQGPTTENCAQCHGIAGGRLDDPVTFLGMGVEAWHTASRGEVISPQRISDSGLNLVGKTTLTRSWDVHAERLLECANCHFAVNNPVYRKESGATHPEGLIFDSRRMPLGAYLQRPSHQFAGQPTTTEETLASDALSCTSCHDPEPTHRWLPYSKRHTDALACEVCHTPELHSVAIESVDWSRLDDAGNPRVTWRGCAAGCQTAAADLIRGVEPALLLREDADGRTRLAPYNLVTSWYWVSDAGAAVPLEQVGEASRGTTDVDEVQRRLATGGISGPRLKGEIRPYPIHHSVAGAVGATRACSSCHDADSRLSRAVVLASAPPTTDLPTLEEGTSATLAGPVQMDESGALRYRPAPAAAGLHVLGHDSVWWANLVGILAVLGTLVGVLAHGGMRWKKARRASSAPHHPAPAVYMYSGYERAWHWVQALAILILLVTGLEIHVTRLGILDFALAVRVHNVVGFVVLANAFFAAFYHLASGEIQHYLPRPQGFFEAAITQARFYLSGIFRGEAHPFEKSPGRKLNPLQQVTYLAILNLLLPLQIVTGILIWGAQRWPAVDGIFGGLVFLAPLHALGAWMFAAFLLMHVYLTTTGPTPMANIQAMVVGWEGTASVEEGAESA